MTSMISLVVLFVTSGSTFPISLVVAVTVAVHRAGDFALAVVKAPLVMLLFDRFGSMLSVGLTVATVAVRTQRKGAFELKVVSKARVNDRLTFAVLVVPLGRCTVSCAPVVFASKSGVPMLTPLGQVLL